MPARYRHDFELQFALHGPSAPSDPRIDRVHVGREHARERRLAFLNARYRNPKNLAKARSRNVALGRASVAARLSRKSNESIAIP